MGIPGLTTYFENRSQQYFEEYDLHNCSLVIDGHTLCNNLYNWHYAYWKSGFSPYCYGGDYDKYAEIVKQFFQLLGKCNVTPYIVFDGCCENDKAPLIKQRLNEKVKINSEITPTANHPTYAIGAVALKYAFMDVVEELKLKAYTCIIGANRKMASLAKHLNCPVLSTDSDFFVSSAMFIPFTSLDYKIADYKNPYKSITCKLYRIENLTNTLNKQPDMHYLLPVLLGQNKFSTTDTYKSFFKSCKIYGAKQKKIDLIFQWLRKQSTLKFAINKILNCVSCKDKESSISKVIKSIVTEYSPVSVTSILEYFDIKSDEHKLEGTVDLIEESKNDIQVSELFQSKFTKCQYPAFFMDILMGDRYFVWPNIEDCSKPDANTIGYTIMAAIHNILIQTDEKQLTVLRRNANLQLEEFVLPVYKVPLPSIEEIEYLQLGTRQGLIFKVLEIDTNFSEIFESFPKEWHLFLLSLKYATSKSNFHSSFIYSLIFCFFTLNYVDPKLKGFYRSIIDLQSISFPQNYKETVEQTSFLNVSEEESLIFMQKVIKYFKQDSDYSETFHREIMHSIAEIQCVFLHLKCLNVLLNYPFENVFIYKVFDGTFIYNMAKIFERETSLNNLNNYISVFLQDCLGIYSVVISIIELLKNHSIE